jgi:hypothetical protein
MEEGSEGQEGRVWRGREGRKEAKRGDRKGRSKEEEKIFTRDRLYSLIKQLLPLEK